MLQPEYIAAIVSGAVSLIGALAAFIKRAEIMKVFKELREKKKIKAELHLANLKTKAAKKVINKLKDEQRIKEVFNKLADSIDNDGSRIEQE